jgi:DNA-binding XRE family transcriptional regulator
VSVPKYAQAAAIIRAQIADGTLLPGQAAPSGAALARMTGYSSLTCRKALSILVKDGVLVPGASASARPRVPLPASGPGEQTRTWAARALSAALAFHRRRAGLTQPQLAEITGFSVTTIGHAETGRVWQSRRFWELADKGVGAGGELLALHDAYRAASTVTEPSPEWGSPGTAATAEAPPSAQAPPTPVGILIVWTDGAITAVPMDRETR